MIEFDYSEEHIKTTINEDYFKRNRYLIRLIDVINKTENCVTLAIDGKWGSGKTVFMHQLMCLLKDSTFYSKHCTLQRVEPIDVNKIECFYFNAWENDLINNPTLNLLNSLIDEYSVFSAEDRTKYNGLLQTLKQVGTKLITIGLLDASDFTSSENSESNPTAKKIRRTFYDIIDLIKQTKCKDKIVIIIDELDRCKPNYAVELLETLKHFYENENLIFLISTDMEQLGYSVKKLYGNDFDGELYLQRFFSAIFTLNSPTYEDYISTELDYLITETHIVHEVCKNLIDYYNLSVREVNKFIKQIKFISSEITNHGMDGDNGLSKMLFVPWGLALKFTKNSKYTQFRQGKMCEEEFYGFLTNDEGLLAWLEECYKAPSSQGETQIDIKEEFYMLYQFIFKTESVRRYEYQESKFKRLHINKTNIYNLIDF